MGRQKLDKNGQRRGGAREGAGRKPTLLPNGQRRASHAPRPKLDGKTNRVQVTMRLASELAKRKKDLSEAIEASVARLADRTEFRVEHVSLARDQVQLVVETKNRTTLTAGVRSFSISMARRLNGLVEREGRVFVDRYEAEVLAARSRKV